MKTSRVAARRSIRRWLRRFELFEEHRDFLYGVWIGALVTMMCVGVCNIVLIRMTPSPPPPPKKPALTWV